MVRTLVLFCCIALLISCASEETTQEAPLNELPPVEDTTNTNVNPEADVAPIPPADPVPVVDTTKKPTKKHKKDKKKSKKSSKKSKKKAKKTVEPE